MKRLLIGIFLGVGIAASAQAANVGDAKAGQGKVAVCSACHGMDGNSIAPNFPKLAGQQSSYLQKQMKDIKSGQRQVPEMTGLLDNLTEKDFADIAAYFSSQPVKIGQAAADKVELGQKIYRAGIADRSVPACTACHMPNGKGNGPAMFPSVSGQYATYIETTLQKYAKAERHNDPNNIMRDIASKLSDEEIKAVAQYMQGLH